MLDEWTQRFALCDLLTLLLQCALSLRGGGHGLATLFSLIRFSIDRGLLSESFCGERCERARMQVRIRGFTLATLSVHSQGDAKGEWFSQSGAGTS